MFLFRMSEIIKKAHTGTLRKSVAQILSEDSSSFSEKQPYDIFLSHSFADANAIYGIKIFIEEMGFRVYVDWLEDSHLNRTKVTKETAALIKQRMNACHSLFFATSETSPNSKWMPWELGYFDGLKSRVAILPVSTQENKTKEYLGQEYLGLYPYVTKSLSVKGNETLWIHSATDIYVKYDEWVKGNLPKQHKLRHIILKNS